MEIIFFAVFSATGTNSAQINYGDCVGVPCTLKCGKNRWVQNCTFPDGICNLSCSVTSCEGSASLMLEHCGQNCSQTPSQCAYQFNETKLKENIHSQTCNATKFNLTSGEQHFVTKQICHCQGDQCHLICNKIQCTQTCRGRKTGECLIHLTGG